MIDWFMLFAPLLLLPIVLLIVFVGCSLNTEGLAVEVRIIVRFYPHTPPGSPSTFHVRIDDMSLDQVYEVDAEPHAVPGVPGEQRQIQFTQYLSRGEHILTCRLYHAGGGTVLIGPSSCGILVVATERRDVVFSAGDRRNVFDCE
jgi:hypothetical protein